MLFCKHVPLSYVINTYLLTYLDLAQQVGDSAGVGLGHHSC